MRVSTSAKRNSFQAKTKVKTAVAKRPVRAIGQTTFQNTLPARAAVDQRALLELERDVLDVAAHHPDHVGQVEGGVEQDQAEIGVDPAEPDIEQEDREHDGDRRHHALRR